MQSKTVLDRYRTLRAISTRFHTGALDCVGRPAMLERAKQLGLMQRQFLVGDSEEEMTLMFDLAVHTAKPSRSRAIDRYAKAARLPPGTDDSRVMAALCQAQFSIWRIERFHEEAGIIVTDVLRGNETWLIDEGLRASGQPGMIFASRFFWPAEFAMTCGVVVPVEPALLEAVVVSSLGWLHHVAPERLVDDPRFATALYRAALRGGVMENVLFQEPEMAD